MSVAQPGHASSNNTVGCEPFIKSQRATHNKLQVLMLCKFGHEVVTSPSETRGTKSAFSTVWIALREISRAEERCEATHGREMEFQIQVYFHFAPE